MTPAHPLLLFRAGFGFYLVFHTGYQLQYGTSSLESLFVAPAAFLLMLWPGSGALFALTVALHFADLMLRPPIQSNHTMMSFFLTLGIGLAYLNLAWRERRLSVSAAQHFELFSPLGRMLLIGMYVFGTFHKINSDFLNPAVSCAVALWRSYGFPAWLQEAPSLHVAIAYGTLVLETVAIVLLLIPRLRWAGMLLGLGFHGFLGFATFQNYHAFSLLAFLLHALFLPPDALARLRESGLARRVEALGGTPRRLLVGLLLAAVAIMLPAMVLWAVICAVAIGFVLLYGRERDAAPLPLIAPAIAV
ncbi:MAG: HTTM domain-containing protein, partial [Pseudomonadota bacterium]